MRGIEPSLPEDTKTELAMPTAGSLFENYAAGAMRCPHTHRGKCTQLVPHEAKTLGERLKKRRLDLHLLQSE